MSAEKNTNNRANINIQITEGVIWKQLLLFFFPILFGTFFQQLYNTVDALILGQHVGTEALAAVGGATSTLTNLVVGFFIGLSSGAGVIISQFYGAVKPDKVSYAVHTSIAFSIIGGLIMMVFGIVGMPAALRAMKTPSDILVHATLYIQVYFAGIIGNLIYNIGSGILRAVGDSRRPMIFLIISCFTNIVLDILFIVVLNMEVLGAAIATILSQAISAVLVLRVLMKTEDMHKLELKKIRLDMRMTRRIIQIGFPAGLQSMMYNLSNIVIQSSVNVLGTDVVAAWTAYSKIDSIFWMMISAFGVSITTFVGQNYGAGKRDRIYKGIRQCLGMAMLATITASVLLYFFGIYVFHLFTKDTVVLSIGQDILQFLVPTFFTYVTVEILSGSLRGIGDCWIPMLITCIGVCVLRILWVSFAVPKIEHASILTIVFSYPMTWTVSSILFILYFFTKSRLNPRKKSI